ncbi:MAG: hypothetical protein ACE3JK_10755 [Sporolactobacillus sp.]
MFPTAADLLPDEVLLVDDAPPLLQAVRSTSGTITMLKSNTEIHFFITILLVYLVVGDKTAFLLARLTVFQILKPFFLSQHSVFFMSLLYTTGIIKALFALRFPPFNLP